MQGKAYMTAEEIKGLLQMTHKQLATAAPYLDDYFYQNWYVFNEVIGRARKNGVTSEDNQLKTYSTHKPITDKVPPQPTRKGKAIGLIERTRSV